MHKKLPQSTVKLVLPSNESYESKTGCNRTLATVLWVPLTVVASTAGTFRKKFQKNSGKTPETLSERFLEFPSRVRLGCPKPYNSRHLRLPERFQNSLPPSTAGDASFFGSGSGEGLSEPVMEFPAVLGVFPIFGNRQTQLSQTQFDKITTRETIYEYIHGNSLLKYTEGGDKTSQCGPRQLGLPDADLL